MSVKVSINECRAGGEPKIFDGEKGAKVARFEVAHNETVTEGSKSAKETRWFQAVAFGPAARFVQEHVHKGTSLTITDGELHYGRPTRTSKVRLGLQTSCISCRDAARSS